MANREEQLKQITEQLEQGVAEIFTSEKYTEYLNTMAKFHNYSFNNTLLIAMQKPEATLVAGYQAWQKKFNRQVKRGEKGIQIIAPAPFKEKQEIEKTDPETGEIIPVAKELLEYLFDYLHPDRERIVDIELYETESRLCYKWKIEFGAGEISAPCVLAYYGLTQDGLYHTYAIYNEIWDTHYDENGETYKEHTRDSYLNFWIVNSETKELIPEKIFNEESEEEYIIWNERYLDMLDLYSEESE